ncbi:tetratricopeptide repeat protein [Nodosilinea sp. PGN35]|uniref:tetratricopeptide repeat protein n=1 Tax=Nodosilinea sp. PGN35 TaxID=3020489 RepID=UPI0023B25D39|nr:tetratricopeptide repeat protein [Nodosilinea sp. TSF1-S3]MDF0367269.1 tetratricopeptide repeat protein [Nodosilinea sp. TSF1-S3]
MSAQSSPLNIRWLRAFALAGLCTALVGGAACTFDSASNGSTPAAQAEPASFDQLTGRVLELYYGDDPDGATLLAEQALNLAETDQGPDHPATAIALNNLAFLYDTAGRHGEAEPLYQRAMAIDAETLAADDLDLALTLNNLAVSYALTGRYDEAEPLAQQALAIRQARLGPDHIDTYNSLINLGFTYQLLGRYSEAEPLYQEALAIAEAKLGPNHSATADRLQNLGELYQAMGRDDAAAPLLERAAAIQSAPSAEGPDPACDRPPVVGAGRLGYSAAQAAIDCP